MKKFIQRNDREELLHQKGRVIWLTGLPCSGKSTLATNLEVALYEKGKLSYVLDGDVLRSGINKNLGFSDKDRKENIRRVAEIAKIMLDAGIIVICSFVSPTNDIRQLARSIVGDEDFLEIYVEASIETCEHRDIKGLYSMARQGKIVDFTGVNAPFEMPIRAAALINTEKYTIHDCVVQLLTLMGL